MVQLMESEGCDMYTTGGSCLLGFTKCGTIRAQRLQCSS